MRRQSRLAALLGCRLAPLLAAAALGLLAASAYADDAELFLSDPDAVATKANVLFIIDTSGSMDSAVQTQPPFDPATAYSGCYDSSALYFSTTDALPACDSPNHLPRAANQCMASVNGLERLGQYADAFLGWDADRARWDVLSSDRPDGEIECQTDRGLHGNGGSALFAANGDEGPWAATFAQEPAWTSRYTVYDGNWLNWKSNPPTVTSTRLEVVQSAVTALLATLDNVNVGVMRFNHDEGGSVIAALEDIETSRDSVAAVVDGLRPDGDTPLSETLYEAAQYFMGRNVDYGAAQSVAASRTGGDPLGATYLSPVTEACAKNFIILLTDGEPSSDRGGPARITALPQFGTLVASECDGSGEGACLDDLAAYLTRRDLNPSLPGLQNVVTHTIGFAANFPLLESTAERGGGEYHLADDTASLASALSGIVLSISDNAGTFAAPSVPVNAFNRTESRSEVYLSVFQPSETARWLGNVKKYRLEAGELVDRNGEPAIDADTGLFSRNAFSFWSAEPDGDRIAEGGAASRLPDFNRRMLFTNVAGNALSGAANRVSPDNSRLATPLADVPEPERRPLIDWALGRDVRDQDSDGDTVETRRDMGDSLHVQPITVLYSGTVDAPVSTVYVTTNDGFLHALDAATGKELWAFIPARLLSNLYTLYRNAPVTAKRYGLDGEINVAVLNDDGRPGISGSERVILLFGMGRGGDAVFAVDVTSRTAPLLLWEISSAHPEFQELGATWSSPSPARILEDGAPRDVAAFGGGYDAAQDEGSFRRDTVGAALYIVELETGRRIWSGGGASGPELENRRAFPDMNFSIPAPVRPLDLTGDGLADRIYVGDMGGQLWRFDIVNGRSGIDLVEGGVLATLGGAAVGDAATARDLRRFYEAPDVVPVTIDRQLVVALNFGSGYRGHPLDTTIDEAFFSVRDFKVFGFIDSDAYPTPVTLDDLVDITDDPAPALPASVAGWRLHLDRSAGEKVLGESITVNDTTFFTTFSPGESVTACSASVGTSRLYAISVFDGRPRTNFDSPLGEPLTVDDRSMVLPAGLPVTDVTIFFGDSETGALACAGPFCLDAEQSRQLLGRPGVRRTYWFQDDSR